ncbi:glycosyl transferase family 90 [Methylobacterium sp. Gmos1]
MMNREEISYIIRSLLELEPESNNLLSSLLECKDIESLIRTLVHSEEFKQKIRLEGFIRNAIEEQLAPWKIRQFKSGAYFQDLDSENANSPSTFLYEICNNNITIIPKTQDVPAVFTIRAEQFLILLQDSLKDQSGIDKLIIAIDVDDEAPERTDYPIFSFQKQSGTKNILLPDFEFTLNNYFNYLSNDYTIYDDKNNKASFAGSTTGKHRVDLYDVHNATVPRIRAAKYFRNQSDVDFRLPSIVQCTAEAEEALRQDGFGVNIMTWDEAYRSKFIISMDGNGATCSRPVLIMRSKSVLLKYSSNYILFWSNHAKPWTHYIPIYDDKEVIDIVRLERNEPGKFHYIALASTNFAEELLCKNSIIQYTRRLLQEFRLLIE